MRLADKVATMARRGAPLPYDAEVEWIANDGNAYIDCDVFPKKNSQLIAKADRVFQSDRFFVSLFAITTWSYRIGNPSTAEMMSEDGDLAVWKLVAPNDFYIPLIIFQQKRYIASVDFKPGSRKGAFVQFYDENGILVRDMVAVRFTNENGESEGAMYDRVSGQLFRNAGTGAFIVGPDVVSTRGGGY